MTDRHERDVDSSDMDVIAQLLRSAGRRSEPPAVSYDRVLAAATDAWHAKATRRRRWRVSLALAASVLIAAASALFVYTRAPAPASIVGRTDRVVGTVELRATRTGPWTTLGDEPTALAAGSELRTRAGSRAGLVLDGGVSLRLADVTDMVLESPSKLQVLSGRIYIDTGGSDARSVAGRTRPIEVITARGTVRDVGTQFEVLYRHDVYRLRVREGRVLLSRRSPGAGQPEMDCAAGDQFTIDASGVLERTLIGAQDPQWEWVQSVAPTPDIDEQPLTMFLAWVSRETGKAVRFASPDVEHRVRQTILHGNIRHLAPMEALEVMLATTDFEPAVSDDTILIRPGLPLRQAQESKRYKPEVLAPRD